MIKTSHFIFYVSDQKKSTSYYCKVLEILPGLYVSGITEFELSQSVILGLLPQRGIEKLLDHVFYSSSFPPGQPRAELYLIVINRGIYHQKALLDGTRKLNYFQDWAWGLRVA